MGTLVLTYYNSEILKNEETKFKQSEIIKIAEKFTTKKVNSARVQQWCNGDHPNSTYNYLRAEGIKRRLTRLREFSFNREFPINFLDSKTWIIKTIPEGKEIIYADLLFWFKEKYSNKK